MYETLLENIYILISQNKLTECIPIYDSFLKNHHFTEYLLIDANPEFTKDEIIKCYFDYGTILKTIAELSNLDENFLNKSIEKFMYILNIDCENSLAKTQLVSIYTTLAQKFNSDLNRSMHFIQTALLIDPTSSILYANLGFLYKSLNNISQSMTFYKIGYEFSTFKNEKNLSIICLNGISCNYRSIKKWPESLFYLTKASNLCETPDFDTCLGLGVVYTELRRTDLAEKSYLLALEASKVFDEKKSDILNETVLLNMGHMYSFNGDDLKSIDKYNEILKRNPKNRYAFQNKLMNLTYFFDRYTDKMYITKQHLLINKILPKNNLMKIFKNKKIHIGFVSGDFKDHPVSFFIHNLLNFFNTDIYNFFCYSESIISALPKNIEFRLIKNKTPLEVVDLLHNDSINILFDLAGHTGWNRLDIFALKPIQHQISYIGYPFTTGLKEMDFRITDKICEGGLSTTLNNIDSQSYYSEKLLNMESCFLNYNPLHSIDISTRKKSTFIKLGCFNRLNKISERMILLFKLILKECDFVLLVFKSKAFLNNDVKDKFLSNFSIEEQKNRISIIDCNLLHSHHLAEYNNIDISIDTFPYSGTTTTCESLYMGTPVLTLYDSTYKYHPQNVSSSILFYSNLEEYICFNLNDFIIKLNSFRSVCEISYKEKIRKTFLNGSVCNKEIFLTNFDKLINKLYLS